MKFEIFKFFFFKFLKCKEGERDTKTYLEREREKLTIGKIQISIF